MKRLLGVLALVVFAASPALADPKSDMYAAMQKFGALKSYAVNATSPRGAVEIDMVVPNKQHLLAGPMEMIRIDGDTWVKMNGKWQKFAMPGIEQMTAGVNNAIKATKANPDDLTVTDLGMKSPDGVPLHAYQVLVKNGGGPQTIYLDGSGMLVRIDSAQGPVTFSKFNAIDIEPPM